MKWISVKDKLPKDIEEICQYDYVFIFGKSVNGLNIIGTGQFFDGKWQIIGESGGYSCQDPEDFKSENVTHWMSVKYIPIDK
jgi:hypothetical protein